MSDWWSFDWENLFTLSLSPVEIFLRGTLTYLGLFLMLRVVLKRETGAISLTDLLTIVLIADAAQNAMAGDYRSITDGILLVATIIFWTYTLDWLSQRSSLMSRLIRPPAITLYEHGRKQRKHMRQEMITEEELLGAVREAGFDNLDEIEKVYLEGDGQFSVIPKEGSRGSRHRKSKSQDRAM